MPFMCSREGIRKELLESVQLQSTSAVLRILEHDDFWLPMGVGEEKVYKGRNHFRNYFGLIICNNMHTR